MTCDGLSRLRPTGSLGGVRDSSRGRIVQDMTGARAAGAERAHDGRSRRLPELSLFWRVFLINALLLIAAAVTLAWTPVTISNPVSTAQLIGIAIGLAAMLLADYILLRRSFQSLEHVSESMREADLLRPGRRVPEVGSSEVVSVVRSYNRMLDRLEAERRESGRRAVAAQEGERARISAELHDEVGQSLTGILLLLERLQQEVEPERRRPFESAQASVRQTLEEVRRIAQELRPGTLDHLGLSSALRTLLRGFSERTGIETDWQLAEPLPALDPEVEVACYRIVQESLTNVARHSDASRVSVRLFHTGPDLILTVRDDGHGMNGVSHPGGGIRGMRERAVIIGGELILSEGEGGGLTVQLRAPLAGER